MRDPSIAAGEEVTRRYARSQRDLLRLNVYVTVALVITAITVWLEDTVLGFEQDVLALVDFLTPTVERVLHGALEWCVLLMTLVVFAVPLLTRRYRLFWYILAANVVALGLMWLVLRLIDRNAPELLVNQVAERAGIARTTSSGELGFAQLTSQFVVLAPFVSARYRRAGLVALAMLLAMRFVVSYHLPVNVFVAVPIGAAAGTAVLLAFGRPDRHPTLAAIRAALTGSGLPVDDVRPARVDARGSPYFATLNAGGELFVKVLGEAERAADLMYRAYRFVRLKDVGDDRPFSSLRRTVEHEALVSLVARDVGVRTPRLRGVVKVGVDSMMLAYDRIDGTSLEAVTGTAVTDALLQDVWRQVGLLRVHRIAHRDLRRANIFAALDGQTWLADFGFAELAVDDALLDADVAQLLASCALLVGPARAVAIAVDAIGSAAVADALPRLQLNALSGVTQTALKHRKGLLEDLQREVQQQCHVAEVRFAAIERVDAKTLVLVLVVVGATYFLLPQFADLPGIVAQVREANWAWAPLVAMMSFVTYVGAAASLAGAVPGRLRGGPLLASQVATSFAGTLAPAGVGGMALSVRFLQKGGVDRPVAVSGVGLNTVAGAVGHISLIGVFIVWAGRDAFGGLKLPDVHWFLLGAAVAFALAGICLLLPYTRHLLARKLWPVLRRAFDGIGTVVRQPTKLVLLLGGSVLTTVGYMMAAYFSVVAFGGHLPLATVGAVFLVGSAVATAAPTPGGLGALEAALIGGFVAAGLPKDIAVPAVFLYRLATFWLPILPGWICFTWLQRRDYL